MANISSATNDTTTDTPLLGNNAKVIIYAILIVLSLTGNVLVIAVVCCNKNLRTVFNWFIVNMAISDLFIPLLSLPIKIAEFATDKQSLWLIHGGFGNASCKILLFLMDISPGVSVFSLVIIAVNRFIAIVKPMSHAELFSQKRCKILIAMTWISVTIFFGLYFYVYRTEMKDYNRCQLHWATSFGSQHAITVFFYALIIVFFVLPFLSIIILYSIIIYKLLADSKTVVQMLDSEEARKRKTRNKHIFFLSLAMIIAFAVFWGPFFILLLVSLITNTRQDKSSLFIVQFLGYSNSIINPLIYFLFMGKFRSGLKRLFRSCLSKKELRGSPNFSNTRSDLLTKDPNGEYIKLRAMDNTNERTTSCDHA